MAQVKATLALHLGRAYRAMLERGMRLLEQATAQSRRKTP
jgi:hypothetical protein